MQQEKEIYLSLIENKQIALKILKQQILDLDILVDIRDQSLKQLAKENIMLKSFIEVLIKSELGDRIKKIAILSLDEIEFND